MTRPLHPRRGWEIKHTDCLQALPKLDASSIDAVVTDPPYGINIASMSWDRPKRLDPTRPPGPQRTRIHPNVAFQRFCAAWASECLRVLKPGGHLTAFASPRTVHRMACGIEEAGLEIRDTLMWLHAQGYPATRRLANGRGTGLKPAYEPIILARRPLEETLDFTIRKYRTGALNIDACRTGSADRCQGDGRVRKSRGMNKLGRWPVNTVVSHSSRCTTEQCRRGCPVKLLGEPHRFFYCTKASRGEREAGCEQLPRSILQTYKAGVKWEARARANHVANIHPTVKPIELMRWLVRLITPPGGLVLDPFTGSGSTGVAALLEGARFIGIERDAAYVPIARARVRYRAKSTGKGSR